jgi:class 3 adenylate cyclase/pSer/pThr/pTyr-binding forkhead associated (FHA) protein
MTGLDRQLIDRLLEAGDPASAAVAAEEAVAREPEDEGLWARLMLSLARSGRTADASRAFQRARRELGREPSDWLVAVQRAVALRDPALADPGATAEFVRSVVSDRPRTRDKRRLPEGVVTFFMTDVVGSTRLWETVPRSMRRALVRHDDLIAEIVESHGGHLVRERGEGDSTFSVFARATDAAAAALTVQVCLADEPWPTDCRITIRGALHTGEASERDGSYYGRVVNRAARLRAIAEPGQVLVSESTGQLIIDHLPLDSILASLGTQNLKDMDRPERVYLLVASENDPEPDEPSDRATDAAATAWEVRVGCDRPYFESNDVDGGRDADWDAQTAVVLTRTSTSVGRPSRSAGIRPDIDVSFLTGDTGVSRSHAVFEWSEEGSLAVVDLSSTNGTFVGTFEEPIPPNEAHLLDDGDRIYIGSWTVLEVHLVEVAHAAFDESIPVVRRNDTPEPS